ncbi:unnamed protein product, partial [Sphacelaria rigidula]
MQRVKVDPERATEAVEAVRSDRMTFHATAKTLESFVGSLQKRVRGSVGIAGRVGPGTVLSRWEENSFEDTLKICRSSSTGLNRDGLKEAAMALWSDTQPVPQDPTVGSGQKWLGLFLRRHPRPGERSNRIFKADRVVRPTKKIACRSFMRPVRTTCTSKSEQPTTDGTQMRQV